MMFDLLSLSIHRRLASRTHTSLSLNGDYEGLQLSLYSTAWYSMRGRQQAAGAIGTSVYRDFLRLGHDDVDQDVQHFPS